MVVLVITVLAQTMDSAFVCLLLVTCYLAKLGSMANPIHFQQPRIWWPKQVCAKTCNRHCQQTQFLVSPTHRDALANAQPMPSHSGFQATASPMPIHMHAIPKPMQLPHRTIVECQATSALERTCPARAICAHQGSPNNCYGGNTASLQPWPTHYQLQSCMIPSRRATDAGAVGSEDYAKAGDGGEIQSNKNLARGFKMIATKIVDVPYITLPIFDWDNVLDIHLWKLTILCCLPHDVQLYHQTMHGCQALLCS